ncbi:PAS domain-containing protein [Oceanibaculum pacificum]|uniref:PAS domain-containing protein n=1 Tax=Oceanibaculum pacificum TaxID=580166 RepID=A0A154W378_9PROT|nr:hypothetical protein [Oceanibaculum pacificum]KZD07946.1 hypothetical protein AUP43_09125 [Oceanibaculum pacificum]
MNVGHAKLRTLYDFWLKKSVTSVLPARSNFLPEEFWPWIGHIAIVDIERPSLRLKFGLFGAAFVYVNNVDMTGRYVDEAMPTTIRDVILDDYHLCLETTAPLYIHRQSVNREWTSIHRLLLPCAEDGRTVDKIITGLYTEGGAAQFSGL